MATKSELPEPTGEEFAAAKARYEALLESADPFVVAYRLMNDRVRFWILAVFVGALFFLVAHIEPLFVPTTVFFVLLIQPKRYQILNLICDIRGIEYDAEAIRRVLQPPPPHWFRARALFSFDVYLTAAFPIALLLYIQLHRPDTWIFGLSLFAAITTAIVNLAFFQPMRISFYERALGFERDSLSRGFRTRLLSSYFLPLFIGGLLFVLTHWLQGFGVGEFDTSLSIKAGILASLGGLFWFCSGAVASVVVTRAHFRAVFGEACENTGAAA